MFSVCIWLTLLIYTIWLSILVANCRNVDDIAYNELLNSLLFVVNSLIFELYYFTECCSYLISPECFSYFNFCYYWVFIKYKCFSYMVTSLLSLKDSFYSIVLILSFKLIIYLSFIEDIEGLIALLLFIQSKLLLFSWGYNFPNLYSYIYYFTYCFIYCID